MSKLINLTEVTVRPSLAEPPTTINLSKELGNYIHFTAGTIPEMRFGDRLFDSEGPIEVTDEEIQFILAASEKTLRAWAQEAVKQICEDNDN